MVAFSAAARLWAIYHKGDFCLVCFVFCLNCPDSFFNCVQTDQRGWICPFGNMKQYHKGEMKHFYLKPGTTWANFPWVSNWKGGGDVPFRLCTSSSAGRHLVMVLLGANKSKDLPPTLSWLMNPDSSWALDPCQHCVHVPRERAQLLLMTTAQPKWKLLPQPALPSSANSVR